MAAACNKPFAILVLYKTNNECFYSCNMERIFSLGERCNRKFHLSSHEYILTIALINIYYLYTINQFIRYIEAPEAIQGSWGQHLKKGQLICFTLANKQNCLSL